MNRVTLTSAGLELHCLIGAICHVIMGTQGQIPIPYVRIKHCYVQYGLVVDKWLHLPWCCLQGLKR